MDTECKSCLFNSFEKQIEEKVKKPDLKKELLNEINNFLVNVNSNLKTPQVARELNQIIIKKTKINDLNEVEKKTSNDFALRHYNELKNLVLKSADPLNTALRLSIAGNIMDFAACPDFFSDTENYFKKTIDKVLSADFAIDDSKELLEKIKNSKIILMLGDNAGEIVLDKLFIETIKHSNVYYAVKSKPVINDATLDDAIYTGINKVAKIITNGYDAPSTILEKASDKFLNYWNKADLIISKGQGNFEGLMENTRENLFFLMMVKCDVIANQLALKKGDFIVLSNEFFEYMNYFKW
ncbi:MAG: DUF89 family protein [Bacteroidales bacterium]|nr:DUF89 family protein [Bacteroidales bacterium]